jgi:hypothetical protein
MFFFRRKIFESALPAKLRRLIGDEGGGYEGIEVLASSYGAFSVLDTVPVGGTDEDGSVTLGPWC